MRFNLLVLFVLLSQYGWAQKSWKTFASEKGAFSADFPGEPQVTSVNRPTPEGIEVKINIHMVTAESVVAYVIYNEFPTGLNILDDSLYLREVARETIAKLNLDTSSIKPITFDGFPGRTFSSKVKDGLTEMKIILRTNRAYIVAGFFPNKRKADLAKFMNSFKFLPYKKPAWYTHESTDYSFKADFPSEPVLDDSEEGSSMLVYYGNDVNSGNNYSLAIEEYSKYDYFESDSAILEQRANAYRLGDDSVLLERDVMMDGRPAKELIMQQGKNHFQLRVLTFSRGLTGYTLFTFLPADEIQGETANHFFQSFKFIGKPTVDLLTDKTDLLLKDIASKDTAIWKKAANAFGDYDFKDKNVDAIQGLIRQSYSDDREEESRKAIMFEALGKLHSEKSIAFIEKIFPTLSFNPALEYAALHVLSEIDTRQSLTLLSKLLVKHKALPEMNYNVFFSPYQLDSANQKFFLLSTIKLLSREEYKSGLYMLSENLLDNKTLPITELAAYKKIILQDFEKQSQVYFQDSTHQDLYYLCEILGYEPQGAKEIATLQKLTKGYNEYLSVTAVITLFRLKQNPDEKQVELLAKNLSSRTNFFSELVDKSLEQKFPKQYANQDSLVIGEFNDYLSGEYDDATQLFSIKIVHETQRDYNGEKRKFYVVSFYDQYDEVNYLGICGPYASDKLYAWGDLTNSDFTIDTGKDYDTYLTNYLSNLEE